MGKPWHPLFILFILVALFGFGYQLITEPLNMLYKVLLILAVGLIFYAIYRYLTKNSKATPPTYRGRYEQKPTIFQQMKIKQSNQQKNKLSKKKKSKEYPFKVIEGNKGKKNKPFSS